MSLYNDINRSKTPGKNLYMYLEIYHDDKIHRALYAYVEPNLPNILHLKKNYFP